ncbi:hypothetical protein QQS21_002770 [Conoideocrella luteorostrata]|uniref:LITAF domain-containing protein n=1 Tax=Conoideocrella luteorostrata TaxID=1105319 RepID=A0AAJ0G124_9HYPO|nr:hypothetical protein QQS21_002770 [Conoideocrella luteorostrata]
MASQQQNTALAQPENTYQPAATTQHESNSNTNIQPAQQTQQTQQTPTEQQAPPPYDGNKEASRGQPQQQPPPGNNQNGQPATVIPLNQLADKPQWIDCPFCHKRTMTIVQREGTSMQIVVGAVLCLFCICLTCVPCLAGWFEDTEYRCSGCKNMVAVRRHDGPLEIFGPQTPVYSQYDGSHPPMDPQQPQHQQQHQQQQHHQPQPQQQQQFQHEQYQQQPQHQQHELHEIQPQVQQHQEPAAQAPVKN